MEDRSPQGDSDNEDLLSRGKSLSTQVIRYASTYFKWFIGLVAGVLTRDLFNRIAEGLLQNATFQHYAIIGFSFGLSLAAALIASARALYYIDDTHPTEAGHQYQLDDQLDDIDDLLRSDEYQLDDIDLTEAGHQTSTSTKEVPSLKTLLAGVLFFYMVGFLFRGFFSPSLLFGIAGFVVVLWGILVLSE